MTRNSTQKPASQSTGSGTGNTGTRSGQSGGTGNTGTRSGQAIGTKSS